MVVAVAGMRMRIHVAVVQQEAHMEGVLASRRGLGGFSNWGCGYSVWGCGWLLVLAHNISLFSHKVPH